MPVLDRFFRDSLRSFWSVNPPVNGLLTLLLTLDHAKSLGKSVFVNTVNPLAGKGSHLGRPLSGSACFPLPMIFLSPNLSVKSVPQLPPFAHVSWLAGIPISDRFHTDFGPIFPQQFNFR